MIVDIKKHIFDKLSEIPNVDIHYQSDNENDNNRVDKFPMITFHRFSGGVHPKNTKRNEVYQITARGLSNADAQETSEKVITLLNRSKNAGKREYCRLEPFGKDIFDPQTKAHGVPMTFVFIIKDKDF